MIVEIQDYCINLVEKYQAGDVSVLETLTRLEDLRGDLEKTLEIIKEFKDTEQDKIADAAKEQPEYRGYKIEVRSGGMMYNFKSIPEWVDLDVRIKDLEMMCKSAFAAAQKGIQTADEDGCEIPLPEVSYRKSNVILQKKR